jgi:hypothetical protein
MSWFPFSSPPPVKNRLPKFLSKEEEKEEDEEYDEQKEVEDEKEQTFIKYIKGGITPQRYIGNILLGEDQFIVECVLYSSTYEPNTAYIECQIKVSDDDCKKTAFTQDLHKGHFVYVKLKVFKYRHLTLANFRNLAFNNDKVTAKERKMFSRAGNKLMCNAIYFFLIHVPFADKSWILDIHVPKEAAVPYYRQLGFQIVGYEIAKDSKGEKFNRDVYGMSIREYMIRNCEDTKEIRLIH